MWALRRASSLRKQGISTSAYRVLCNASSNASLSESKPVISQKSQFLTRFYSSSSDGSKFHPSIRTFSSHVETKSGGEEEEDELEDGFSDLETTDLETTDTTLDQSSSSDSELSEVDSEEDDEIGGSENEMDDVSDTKPSKRKDSSEMFKFIMSSPALSVHNIMNKWVESGKEVSQSGISLAMLNLRKRRMYGRALQLSEWLESRDENDFTDREYSSRADLIAKVRGLHAAESYVKNIPEAFQTEVVYRTLLANAVSATNIRKAEEIFNKMKTKGFSLTSFSCNQLLLLYKKVDKKKIADILLLMEKEDIKPSLFTYKILIDTKGQSNDIDGMEQVIETMKAEGIEPDLLTKGIIAKHYIFGGVKDKAEAMLTEMEGENVTGNRWAVQLVLPLYADLGKGKDVKRVWEACESNASLIEYMACVTAFGKLKQVDEAEEVFDKMEKKWRSLTSKHYSVLLKVYANNKMLIKGKDLVKRMSENGCKIGPLTWDSLVKLYVEAGEVEKADAMLQKAVEQSGTRLKAMFRSYMCIMDEYAKRGDVHNTEKMFRRMRVSGYVSRLGQFQCLVKAYSNGKVPIYGIHERLKADNVFPNKALAAQLAMMDPFRKTAVSDLLD